MQWLVRWREGIMARGKHNREHHHLPLRVFSVGQMFFHMHLTELIHLFNTYLLNAYHALCLRYTNEQMTKPPPCLHGPNILVGRERQ